MRFKDIDESLWVYKAIEFLSENNITEGYEDGTFKPNNFLTRAEAVVFIVRSCDKYNSKKKYNASVFSDVNDDDWYANYLGFAHEEGLVSGYEDGTFKPNNFITRAEIATIINKI